MMRAQISEAVRQREAAFQARKVKKVLRSVLQKPVLRFNYKSITTLEGEIITDQEEIQKTLNATFEDWHSRKPLIDLATYLCDTPNLWNNFNKQRDLPSIPTSVDIPPDIVRLFTEALLHTEDDGELFDEMRQVLYSPVEFEDFIKALQARSNNKSPGITGCTINMMKQWTERIQRSAYEAMNLMWEERYIPPWWKDKWVVLIPKDDTPNIPTNRLRPICLLETSRKVWTAIIIARIMGILQKRGTLQPMQSGFTAGQGTDTCLLQCINAIEQAEQDKSSLYYVSYDISKAFDRPPKELLKICWHRIGVPEDIVEWLVNLDLEGRCYIKSPWAQKLIQTGQLITDTDCEFYTAATGVPQGSSEGAITWVILFDVLLTMIKKANASPFPPGRPTSS
jgi:hypothetical protein